MVSYQVLHGDPVPLKEMPFNTEVSAQHKFACFLANVLFWNWHICTLHLNITLIWQSHEVSLQLFSFLCREVWKAFWLAFRTFSANQILPIKVCINALLPPSYRKLYKWINCLFDDIVFYSDCWVLVKILCAVNRVLWLMNKKVQQLVMCVWEAFVDLGRILWKK